MFRYPIEPNDAPIEPECLEHCHDGSGGSNQTFERLKRHNANLGDVHFWRKATFE
jgi:hypothetical protein